MGIGEASKTAEGFDRPRNGLRSELFHIAAAGTEAHRELLARHDLGCTARNRADDHEMYGVRTDVDRCAIGDVSGVFTGDSSGRSREPRSMG